MKTKRLDHGTLTALLVPTPTPAIVIIWAILERHNLLEESSGGVYEQCEQLAGAGADEILKRLMSAPAVKVFATCRQCFRYGSRSARIKKGWI